MDEDENNKIIIHVQTPLHSDMSSYVLFYGGILLIILIILFIFIVILSSNSEPVPEPKPSSVYTNRYYNSSLDEDSMSFASFKSIKSGGKKIKRMFF